MTKERCLLLVAAVLTTLLEIEQEGSNAICPESTLYLLCDSNMEEYSHLATVMQAADWIKINAHLVKLTDHGREVAGKLQAVIPA